MKTIITACLFTMLLSATAFAHEGHDHGNSAFENQGGLSNEFTLTEHQIKNLQLATAKARQYDFYETISVPIIVNSINGNHSIAQGFILEGSEILKVKPGQAVVARVDAMPNKSLTGKITMIDNMIDPRTRLYSVIARIDTALPKNGQGLRGQMVVRTETFGKGIAVPPAAIQGEFGGFFVFVHHGDHFERRAVVVGGKTNELAAITEGLAIGEQVVTTGAYQLRFASGTPIGMAAHSPEQHAGEEAHDHDLGHGHEPAHDHEPEHDHGVKRTATLLDWIISAWNSKG